MSEMKDTVVETASDKAIKPVDKPSYRINIGPNSTATEDREIAVGDWHFYGDGTVSGPDLLRCSVPELAELVRGIRTITCVNLVSMKKFSTGFIIRVLTRDEMLQLVALLTMALKESENK